MKVRINAGGREVEVETADANMTTAQLEAEALAMWKQTEGAAGSAPAYGFSSERKPRYDEPTHMGRYGIAEIQA